MDTASALIQAPDGYLWIGSQEGLVRFDGVTFTLFNKRNTPCLNDQWILRLAPMPDGSVWVIPLRGAPSLLTRDGFTCPPMPEGVPARFIKAIVPAAGGGMWVAAFGEGVFLVRDGRLVRAYRGAPHQLSSNKVLDLAAARDGSLWVATDGGGVNHIRADGSIEVFDAASGLSSSSAVQVLETRDGSVWVGTSRGVDSISSGRIDHLAGVSAVVVSAIIEDRGGSVWFGTEEGLFRLQDGDVTSFTEADGLSSSNIRTLLEDREGSMWIGTYGGGIDQLSDGLFTPYSTADGLSDDFVWSVFEDVPGRIWIGTDSGGLNRLENGVISVDGRAEGLADDTVRSIYRDRAGTLWVGTRKAGLKRYDGATFSSVESDDPRCDSDVSAIAEDRDGTLWVESRGKLANQGSTGVLCRLIGGRLRLHDAASGGIEDLLSCMRTSHDGRLFLCGTHGLYVIDRGKITTYSMRDGLSSDFVTTVYEESDGTLWIGTAQAGLNRLKDGVISHATTAEGLFDDKMHAIVDDGLGYLWMSSNRGITRVSKRELDDLFAGRITSVMPDVYGSDSGMRSAECNGASQYPAWRASDGRLWFATMKGAVVIDPKQLGTNPIRPQVLIERIAADGVTRALRGGISVAPGTHAIEFTYTATSLLASDRIRFKYKLEGFDQDWTDAGARRTRYYTNLPPGDYVFRVIAANSDGLWNEDGASVGFRLEPRFHQTWWFLASCMLAVLAIIFAIHRVGVRHLRRRERELQQRVTDRTYQIANAAQALRASEAFSRTIVGNVGEGIITFDGDGEISNWNRAAERIFEHTADEAIGNTADLLGLSNALEVGATGAVAEHARRKDGAVIPVEIHATEASIDGAPVTIWLVRDLTESRRAEAKVAAIQRELVVTSRRAGMAQVATSVLHNVGNALNGVNVSADIVLATLRRSKVVGLGKALAMLDEDPAALAAFLTTTEKGRQLPTYLARVNGAIQRERETAIEELESMEKGIEHIKAIVSSQQSHARVDRIDELIVLPDLLGDAIRFERALCEMAGVTVRTDHADLPPVRVDRHGLLEIVMNLLVNAREALQDGAGERLITVRTRPTADGSVAIEVCDTGIGIAPDNLVKIFSQGYTTKTGGHGFGLHGASCTVIELGGTLSVESEGVGKGARFVVVLPMARAIEATQAA
ncbi:MAG TPA: two-component regulator propeller domain-containing protein [Kofleriaceae bacterium]|nr:two-component regulator propeller domain-containing protein [Kofleriaceae bacterium]